MPAIIIKASMGRSAQLMSTTCSTSAPKTDMTEPPQGSTFSIRVRGRIRLLGVTSSSLTTTTISSIPTFQRLRPLLRSPSRPSGQPVELCVRKMCTKKSANPTRMPTVIMTLFDISKKGVFSLLSLITAVSFAQSLLLQI